ncbi:MAG TPA: hypothetical protein VFP98_10965, partial [Candidatus Polarisedimenticolia bacterium]|nr:hypothetical protein [Candidatus Polarisedimenticolia bacterium]
MTSQARPSAPRPEGGAAQLRDQRSRSSASAAPTLLHRALPAIFLTSRALIELVGRLPRPLGHAVAAAVSVPLRRITWKRCRANIDIFFGPLGWSIAERDRLFRAHQRYMVRLRLEAARVLAGPPGEVEKVTE